MLSGIGLSRNSGWKSWVSSRTKRAVGLKMLRQMDRINSWLSAGVLRARPGEWRKLQQDPHDALSMADRERPRDSVVLRWLLTNYAYVLRRNHHERVARGTEARAATLRRAQRWRDRRCSV
jgi:hypothetical protein